MIAPVFVACAILASLLAVALVASATAKLTKVDRVVENITGTGVPLGWFPWLAAAELAGAAGLVVGLGIEPLGVAAAVGVVLYFIGAVIAHVRVGDYAGISAPGPLLVVAATVLVLRLASMSP